MLEFRISVGSYERLLCGFLLKVPSEYVDELRPELQLDDDDVTASSGGSGSDDSGDEPSCRVSTSPLFAYTSHASAITAIASTCDFLASGSLDDTIK